MMLKVYICSPYKGDIEKNTEAARRYCRFAYEQGEIPVAPHLYFPQFMDDNNPDEREKAIEMNLDFLKGCHHIWVFGDEITEGMQQELLFAKMTSCSTPRYFTSDCKETDGFKGKKKYRGLFE